MLRLTARYWPAWKNPYQHTGSIGNDKSFILIGTVMNRIIDRHSNANVDPCHAGFIKRNENIFVFCTISLYRYGITIQRVNTYKSISYSQCHCGWYLVNARRKIRSSHRTGLIYFDSSSSITKVVEIKPLLLHCGDTLSTLNIRIHKKCIN